MSVTQKETICVVASPGQDRLEKIQKDIQTLEKAVYSKNASLPSDNVVVNEALTRQLSKISELEKQIQQMTSKFEENNYKLQQLSDRLNKVSNDSQLRFQQLESNKAISEKFLILLIINFIY